MIAMPGTVQSVSFASAPPEHDAPGQTSSSIAGIKHLDKVALRRWQKDCAPTVRRWANAPYLWIVVLQHCDE